MTDEPFNINNEHNIVSQAPQQKPCIYVYCVIGVVLLQARKLKLKTTRTI